MAAKKTTRNKLDAADRNALPGSAYAFPRLRKEPLTDAKHVRNAIARFDQVKDATDEERDKAFRRIKRAASKYDVEVTEGSWRELGKPTKNNGKPKKSTSTKSKPAKTSKATASKATASKVKSSDKSKAELYAEAKKRGVEGRSAMSKAELRRALKP
jgi:hypothetical protein